MTDIINGEIYNYFGTEEALSEATHITNIKTGVRVELSNNTKALYARMRKRFHFFTTSNIGGNKGLYHDNVDELAAIVGISKSTALRCLEDLKQVGLVIANLSGRSNQWTVASITPDCFLLERNAGTAKKPVWVDCLKYPVFGSIKEDAPDVQPEDQRNDSMCELDELPEEEALAPEKVKPAPKPKPAPKKALDKQQAVSPFEFKKPRDETKDWFYFQRCNDADQFTVLNDFDLPYLAMFESQGKLKNQHSIQHLKAKREVYARTKQT